MKEEQIKQAYNLARDRYSAIGVDTEKVIAQMQDFHLSMHCWQADDVTGFEAREGGLTGGIQVNGNYPGKARNIMNCVTTFSMPCRSSPASTASISMKYTATFRESSSTATR